MSEEKSEFSKHLGVFIFGATCLIGTILIVFILPEPSSTQKGVLRVLIAIAGAGIFTVFPGLFFIDKFGISAGGAIGVFVFLLLLDPLNPNPNPSPNNENNKPPPSSSQSSSSRQRSPIPTLRIHGSNTMGTKLVPDLIKEFGRQRGKGINLQIQAFGSLEGLDDLVQGKCDIAMSSHQLSDEEKARRKLTGEAIGLDGIAIIVHPDNNVVKMSLPEIAAVYRGEITDWGKFEGGTPGNKINVKARDSVSGTTKDFKALVLDNGEIIASNVKTLRENSDLAYEVANDINAIGFLSFTQKGPAKLLPVYHKGDVPRLPTVATLKTEQYPLFRRLYLYRKNDGSDDPIKRLAQDFITFASLNDGQEIVEKAGFIGLANIEIISQSTPTAEQRPPSNDEYSNIKNISEQLNTVFKYRSCSDRLDDRGIRDIDRVINELTKPIYRGRTVYVLGFTDCLGSTELNDVLSKFRAKTVKEALEKGGIERLEIKGFGKRYAIVTDENKYDPYGRANDRRVEIWIQTHQ